MMKLIHLRKFCQKMHTHKSLLINAFKNSFKKPQIPAVPKKELIVILPYLGKMSQIVKTRVTETMKKHIKFCKLRVFFQINNRLKNYFCFIYFAPGTL